MIVKKETMTPAERAALENAEALTVTNQANIDYLAMMTDVEIPTEDGGAADESEV